MLCHGGWIALIGRHKLKAKQLATDAIALFEKASSTWTPQLAEARVWLDNPQ